MFADTPIIAADALAVPDADGVVAQPWRRPHGRRRASSRSPPINPAGMIGEALTNLVLGAPYEPPPIAAVSAPVVATSGGDGGAWIVIPFDAGTSAMPATVPRLRVRRTAESIVDELVMLYSKGRGGVPFCVESHQQGGIGGGALSLLAPSPSPSSSAHAVATARAVAARGATDALVVSALLHDIGHLLTPRDVAAAAARDDTRRRATCRELDVHDVLGSRWLRQRGFPRAVSEPVSLHSSAKSYLKCQDNKCAVGCCDDFKYRHGPFAKDAVELVRSWSGSSSSSGGGGGGGQADAPIGAPSSSGRRRVQLTLEALPRGASAAPSASPPRCTRTSIELFAGSIRRVLREADENHEDDDDDDGSDDDDAAEPQAALPARGYRLPHDDAQYQSAPPQRATRSRF